jgi:hypothetical protein
MIDMFQHHPRFTIFVIVSNKENEWTVNELLPLIQMKVIQVDYE